jgi:hypothetical protein
MTKIMNAPNGSMILNGIKSCKRSKGLLSCLGVTCMPICCTGIVCLTMGSELGWIAEALADVVNFYGGEQNVKRIAAMVEHEQNIFMRAFNNVNTTISPQLIDVNLTLLDIIICNVPKTGSIIEQSQSITKRTLSLFKTPNQEYKKAVWDMYTSMGGNYRPVVYGLIEYLCQMHDPTSNVVMYVVDQFNHHGPLRNECALHKC